MPSVQFGLSHASIDDPNCTLGDMTITPRATLHVVTTRWTKRSRGGVRAAA
ncbi:hypothetical protein ACFWGN_05635 [Oerskovia sp. NPDC060338]|uniref:hypothetical protein n=1 Tax=Oerskovia sp. NPDC060338 TaxID=3347100 RepID=UPI0036601202